MSKMQKKYKIVAAIIITTSIILGVVYLFITKNNPTTSTDNKMVVSASFYPVYQIVHKIGGDKIELSTIVPNYAEPHEYEITPDNIFTMQKSTLIFVNGYIDHWVEEVNIDSNKIINLGSLISQDRLLKDEAGNIDVHYWQSLDLIEEQARIINDMLKEKDQTNASYYQDNLNSYIAEINNLRTYISSNLKNCNIDTFLTFHKAYDYLAKEININTSSVKGYNSEEDISSSTITEVSKLIKSKSIKYLLIDAIEDKDTAEKIASNLGIQTLTFYTLEGADLDTNMLDLYKTNISNLQKSLECQNN
jgi:zinc transport system substrate-binding protein